MNDFRKYYFAVILFSATLIGCSGGGGSSGGDSGGGDDGTATPPAAMPAVNAGDDQNVIEDDVVRLGATASGFSGNPSSKSAWPLATFLTPSAGAMLVRLESEGS